MAYTNPNKNIENKVVSAMASGSSFESAYMNNSCIQKKVNETEWERKQANSESDDPDGADPEGKKKASFLNHPRVGNAAHWYNNDKAFCENACAECFTEQETDSPNENSEETAKNETESDRSPFDRRLDRLWQIDEDYRLQTPYSPKLVSSSIDDMFMSAETLTASSMGDGPKKSEMEKVNSARKTAQDDPLNQGPPSLMNEYSLTTLYGVNGGKSLVNKRNERKWYEIDNTGFENKGGYSSIPTTTSIISWGAADPFKRTPYHFTDFVFSKHWNKIENNRLVTLRRYAAPIYDNLKFPGMEGDAATGGIAFPPMATAITYFGDETGNELNNLIKFTTGVKWGETEAKVWDVQQTQTPDSDQGPTGIYKGIGTMAKYLSIFGGKTDNDLIMNKGSLPPDPYTEGPYANRMMGPINRISEVKKREPGIEFKWDGLKIVFEYVARPVGGVNPKAVLLDIMSNFLIIGSAKAVFFGGQHRFMGKPAMYPFAGGDSAMKDWYTGNPIGWASKTIKNFSTQIKNDKGTGILDGLMDLFKGGLSGITDMLTGKGSDPVSNTIKHSVAASSAGQIPYLSGMKAVLTGEPVGDWHITIGNPLNPIAMIGNLICSTLDVEFGNEIGPDDFPTEIKVTVNLEHGMARDRDGIQSIFNRGMGRIYALPDEFTGSSDKETGVDRYTGKYGVDGEIASIKSGRIFATSKTSGGNADKAATGDPTNSGEQSVWNRGEFSSVSPNSNLDLGENGTSTQYRNAFVKVDWIALKSLT